jgi:hypothetical protein
VVGVAAGAVSGDVSALVVVGVGVAAGATGGALGSAAGSATRQYIATGTVSGEQVLAEARVGFVVGGITGGLGAGLPVAANALRQLPGPPTPGLVAVGSGAVVPAAVPAQVAVVLTPAQQAALTSGLVVMMTAPQGPGQPPAGSVGPCPLNPVAQVGEGVSNWLGPGARVLRSDARGFVIQSQDGLRQFRIDYAGPGTPPPHAHFEVWDAARQRWVDAVPGQHRFPFGGG